MANTKSKRLRVRLHWTLAERLDYYTDKSAGSDACWPWTGCTDRHGYGLIKWQRKARLVTRLTWELANGPIPDGQHICHRCDNPLCRNVKHLWLGTNSENMADREAKGRTLRGEKNSSAKLTEADVRSIRTKAAGTKVSIAKRYGISPQSVYDIVARRTWKHLS